jgi:hypothetical protein
MQQITELVSTALSIAAGRLGSQSTGDHLPAEARDELAERARETAELGKMIERGRLRLVEEPSSAATLLALVDDIYAHQQAALIRASQAPSWIELANDLLDYQRAEFDRGPNEDGSLPDLQLSGSDLIDWFTRFRVRVAEAVAAHARIVREIGAATDTASTGA